jgi:hypothetical protein
MSQFKNFVRAGENKIRLKNIEDKSHANIKHWKMLQHDSPKKPRF